MKKARLAAALAVLIAAAPTGVWAFPDDPGTRALAMGGAGRADARGDQGPRLNPSGMSLVRLYSLEGAYQFITRDGGHLAHVSVVDSTSASNLAGGLYYSFRTATPAGLTRLVGHEVGLSLSYPLADRVFFGATGKYVYASGGFAEPDGGAKHTGVTADVGVTLRAASFLSVAIVGYNLHDLATIEAPVAIGYGVALDPVPDLMIAIDGFHDLTTSDPTRAVRSTIGGGAEYMLLRKTVLRAGVGRDGESGHDYATAGVAAVSELGAIDFGVRQDISGDQKRTVVAVGLRLFVPQP